jgi:hypothetical protein
MKETTNEWYVETGFSDLAGPYCENEKWMLERAINHLKAGKIPYEVVYRSDAYWLRRQNMIVRKRYYKLKDDL